MTIKNICIIFIVIFILTTVLDILLLESSTGAPDSGYATEQQGTVALLHLYTPYVVPRICSLICCIVLLSCSLNAVTSGQASSFVSL